MQPRQQIDAGLDHRGRVEIGRGGRWRRHRAGEPELEGELRRLGERAQQEQHQRRREDVQFSQPRRRYDLADREVAHRLAQEHHARQHRQPARGCDDQRTPRPVHRAFVAAFEGDQQVAGNAGAFPEDKEQEEIVGPDHAEHTGHERKEEQVEVALPFIVLEVVVGVEGDDRADAGDDHPEKQPQPVETERQVEAQIGYPRIGEDKDIALAHRGQDRQQPAADGGRRRGGQPGEPVGTMRAQQPQERPAQPQHDKGKQ